MLCPRHIWLFLHQGQQHLPAQLHCSHGNASKQQPDRQTQEMWRGKQRCDPFCCCCCWGFFAVILLHPSYSPLSPELKPKMEHRVLVLFFSKLELQAPESATQAAQTAHFGCLFRDRAYIFQQFQCIPLRWVLWCVADRDGTRINPQCLQAVITTPIKHGCDGNPKWHLSLGRRQAMDTFLATSVDIQ